MEKQSLKKRTIFAYSNLPEIEGLEGNKVILVTPAGIITGKLIKESENVTYKIVEATLENAVDSYCKDNEIENWQLSGGNDGYLTLENAELSGSFGTRYFGFLTVFIDQIIGITIGNPQTKI